MRNASSGFLLVFACLALASTLPAHAQMISQSYDYFNVRGRTMAAIKAELDSRGPAVGASGSRHPGATRMQFFNKVAYARAPLSCRIKKAVVRLTVKVILPRWVDRRGAGPDVALLWDTLASDIRRHEDQHVGIAREHARQLQVALAALRPRRTCDALRADVASASARILKQHDEAQVSFDRTENANFAGRYQRLLEQRMKRQARTGRLPQ